MNIILKLVHTHTMHPGMYTTMAGDFAKLEQLSRNWTTSDSHWWISHVANKKWYLHRSNRATGRSFQMVFSHYRQRWHNSQRVSPFQWKEWGICFQKVIGSAVGVKWGGKHWERGDKLWRTESNCDNCWRQEHWEGTILVIISHQHASQYCI